MTLTATYQPMPTRASSSTWHVEQRSRQLSPVTAYSRGMLGPTHIPHVLTHVTRHCADAVLSLSNEITLVASVAAPLLDFASIWAWSNSGYDFLVSQAFPPSWCSLHRPVISLPNPVSYSVYSAIDPLEPNGSPIRCHRGCGCDNLHPNVIGQRVKVKCLLCRSTCEVNTSESKARTAPGRKGIQKAAFPTTWAETDWTAPKEQNLSSDHGVTVEVEGGEARGRPPKGTPSRGRGSRRGRPAQTHSVPRLLPSQALPPHTPLFRTMSQAPPQHSYPTMNPLTAPLHTPPMQFLQPFQGGPPLLPFLPQWSPSALPPPPLALPPPQTTSSPPRQAKRQKTDHDSPSL